MTQGYGTTLFCDDIRDEVNGKKTFVGVYSDRMLVDSDFPVIIPTLGFYIQLLEELDNAEGAVQIKILVPGQQGDEVIVDVSLPSDRAEIVNRDPQRDREAKFLTSIVAFRASPLLLQKKGRIKVRAYKGDQEIRLGTLLVTKSETALNQSHTSDQGNET